MKLLPQYSIRLMLTITALAAGVFSIVGLAVRGNGWAIGVSVGVAAIAIALLTYAAFFGLLWMFSLVSTPLMNRRLRPGQVTLAGTSSPFAAPDSARTSESSLEAIIIQDSDTAVDESGDSVGGDRQP